MNWKLREINQTIEIFIKKKIMNKFGKTIKNKIRESLDEKSQELHSEIENKPWEAPKVTFETNETWVAPKVTSENNEDWNPQGPVTISGTDISEEDEFEMGDEEETDITDKSTGDNDETCKYHMANFGPDDERTQMFCKGSITERLHGGQKRLDRNKNGRLDKEDFKLLRGSKKKKEVGEIELSKLRQGGEYEFESPSFKDKLEYTGKKEYPSGSPMYSFKGKKAGSHLMGNKDVESFVSDFDNDFEDIEAEDVPLGKRRYNSVEDIEFEEPKKSSFLSRMKGKLGLGKTDEMEEGNAFTNALRKTKKGGKFKLGGKTYTDRSNLDEAEKFIQKAVKKMEKKGTEGSFKEYCGGEVTKSCIDKAMKSGDPKLVKKANFAKNIKAYKGAEHKKKSVKESIELTESEMINLIEQIVLEKKSDKSFGGKKPKGWAETEKALKGSKKENDDYIKSVTQKLKDYLKDGSKGGYETSPKHFPKGNGELAKMDRMAYQADNATSEYIENFTAAGQENLVYDEIHPDEDRITSNIEGSSKTGNNPKWSNAVETGVNKKRNQIRKDNLLGAVKDIAYNKAPQPAEIVKGNSGRAAKFKQNYGKDAASKATKILNQLESTEEKNDILLSEEFNKIKNLMNYDKRTQ